MCPEASDAKLFIGYLKDTSANKMKEHNIWAYTKQPCYVQYMCKGRRLNLGSDPNVSRRVTLVAPFCYAKTDVLKKDKDRMLECLVAYYLNSKGSMTHFRDGGKQSVSLAGLQKAILKVHIAVLEGMPAGGRHILATRGDNSRSQGRLPSQMTLMI